MISNISFGRTPATIQRRKETKNGLKKAEKLLRDFRESFGKPNSATYLQLKISKHKDNPKYAELSKKLTQKAEAYAEAIIYEPYRSIANITKKRDVAEAIVGDCGECAQAVQNQFLIRHSQPTVNVVMNIEKENGNVSNHAFNLSNIEKGIDSHDPKTWGERAIVTDPWSGIALKSSDAIDYYKNLFGVTSSDKVSFELMPVDNSNIQKACVRHFEVK